MKKRIFSMLLAIVMVVGLLPATALAEEVTCTCGTDDAALHATDCPEYIAPADPECSCAEKCAEDEPNEWCDVCGVLGADACLGADTAVPYLVDFPLYIGSMQVDSTNMDDITSAINEELGEKVAIGDASYDMYTGTLTLDGFSYMGESDRYAAITYSGSETLNIHLIGENSVRLTDDTQGYAIYSPALISITAESGASLELGGIFNSCSGKLTLGEGLKKWGSKGEAIDDHTVESYLYIAAEFKEEAAEPDLTIGSVTLTDAQLCIVDEDDDGYAAFDPRTNTLTLKNYDLGFVGPAAILYKGAKTLHIRLIGENRVTNADEYGNGGNGIVAWGPLTISGDGSLKVTAAGYGVRASGSITVTGGMVEAYTVNNSAVSANGSIEISGGSVGASATSGSGVFAGGNITVTGGEVYATGSDCGVYAEGSITITGGSVDAEGDSRGMCANRSININGGSVDAEGNIYGVSAGDSITIGGGTVEASAVEGIGVYAGDSIDITGGMTMAGGGEDGLAFNKAPDIVSGWAAYDMENEDAMGSLSPIAPDADWTKLNVVMVMQDQASIIPIAVGDMAFFTDEGGNINTIEGGDGTATLEVEGGNTAAPVYTLTLNNFTYSGPGVDGAAILMFAGSTYNLKLVGDSKITLMPSSAQGVGLFAAGGDLTVSGDGSLTLVVDGETYEQSRGVYVDGDLTMQGGSITVVAGDAITDDGTGESAGVYVDGDLTMEGDSELIATGGEADYISTGVYVGGNVNVTSGSITATGGEADAASYGVYVGGDVDMSGDSSITATGGDADGDSCGVYAVGDLTVTSGSITATGGDATDEDGISCGLEVDGDLALNGGSIDATGGDATGKYGESDGVYVGGGLTIEGGSVTATAGKAEEMSAGVYLKVGNLAVTNGSVTGKGGDAGYTSAGVYLKVGNLTVNGGSVTGTGGKATGTEKWSGSSGGIVVVGGSVTVTNGSVTGTGGEAEDTFKAAESEGNVANMQSSSAGIMAMDKINVSSGSVTGTGGSVSGTEAYPGMSIGIMAVGGANITGGTTVAQGETGAFMAAFDENTITFENATVWYGESADAANEGDGTPASEIADTTVYTGSKYVRIAERGSTLPEPPVVTNYDVWVGGERFTSDKLTIPGDKGTATLSVDATDPENPTYTLTLRGYEYIGGGHQGAVIYSEVPLTIKPVGENRVISYGSGMTNSYGVYVAGALTVEPVKGTGELAGVLTAIGDKSAEGSYGIKAASIDVTGDVHLTAEGKTAWGSFTGFTTDGIFSVNGGNFVVGTPAKNGKSITVLGGEHYSATEVNGESHKITCNCGVDAVGGHILNYTAEGNVLTGQCAICEFEVTYTLTAPENAVYDGTEHEVTVTVNPAVPVGISVEYKPGNVEAGEVTASLTMTGVDGKAATATVTYTITPAEPTITVTTNTATAQPGDEVEVTVTAAHPTNNTLTDLPTEFTLTYKVGDGDAQTIENGRFTVPLGTKDGTVITVTATNTATGNYTSGVGTHTLAVSCTHSGGTATCMDQAVCEMCGDPYGEKDASNHTEKNTTVKGDVSETCGKDGYTGDTYCKCGEKIASGVTIPATGKHIDGDDENHDCDTCFAPNVDGGHHGGTATCMAPAVCAECGQSYGEKDASNHTKQNTTVKNAVTETCGKDGYTGDTYCECGVKIADGKTIPATGKHSYTAAFDWAADCSSATVTVSCGVCKDEQKLTCEISSQWDVEADTLTFTASAGLDGETFTDTQTIQLAVVGGKLTITNSAAAADENVDMIIMVAGYTGGQMTGCQIIDSVTGVTEKTLTVTGDTIKVFFLKPGTYAPLFACAEL